MNFTLSLAYLCYHDFTQESPEKEKKGVETPDWIIKLDHKCLLMYSYRNSIIQLNNITQKNSTNYKTW